MAGCTMLIKLHHWRFTTNSINRSIATWNLFFWDLQVVYTCVCVSAFYYRLTTNAIECPFFSIAYIAPEQERRGRFERFFVFVLFLHHWGTCWAIAIPVLKAFHWRFPCCISLLCP